VDVIFAIGSSADTSYKWLNGTSLHVTYQRSFDTSIIGKGTTFPEVPDPNTFVNLGLNKLPTFFGCNQSNSEPSPPLVVYIPNSPYVYYSNVSAFDLEFNNTERNAIIQNGYDVATGANGTLDAQWPMCVGCAILSRSLIRTDTEVPDLCYLCFKTYCWDGTVNSTTPLPYDPKLSLTPINLEGRAARILPMTKKLASLILLMTTLWIVF